MKRKIIFSILIVIILLNVLEIMSSKDTYVYCDENNIVASYEHRLKTDCKFEKEGIVTLTDTGYFSDWKSEEHIGDFSAWTFEAKSQGTTKVYLYRHEPSTKLDELTYKDAVAVITLTVDENNYFVYERKFDYLWRVYMNNFRGIFFCIFLMIIPYIKVFKYREKRIKILNVMLIAIYVIDIWYYWIINVRGGISLLSIICILLSVLLRIIFSKLYNKEQLIFKILLWNTGILLAAMFLSGLWVHASAIFQGLHLFVIAYILYCCGSKGIVDNN